MSSSHQREALAALEKLINCDSVEEYGTYYEKVHAYLSQPETVDMVLYCPKCHTQHIDAPEVPKNEPFPYTEENGIRTPVLTPARVTPPWTNPPHKSHLCHGCGHIWRPSDTPTNGVERTASGKDADTAPLLRPEPKCAKHPDDEAVDRFAQAMKEKLAAVREKGRSGWQTCSQDGLSWMLRDHVAKGDPRDVANFCVFLWELGYGISAPTAAEIAERADYSDGQPTAALVAKKAG